MRPLQAVCAAWVLLTIARGAVAAPFAVDADFPALTLATELSGAPVRRSEEGRVQPGGRNHDDEDPSLALVRAEHLDDTPLRAPSSPSRLGEPFALIVRRPVAIGVASFRGGAGAAVAEDEDDALDDPAPPRPVGAPALTAAGGKPGLGPSSAKERKWGLAPIEWRGQLSSSYGWSKSGTGSATLSNADALSLSASSYVWQPWFARISANTFLSRSVVSTNESKPVVTSISGGGGVDLFPVSRFPFSANYNITSNAVSGSAVGNDVLFQRLSMTQAYRPATNAFTSHFGYDWSQFDNAQAGVDSINRFSGSFAMTIPTENPQNVNANGSYTVNENSKTGNGSKFTILQGTHALNWIDYGLLLNSDANFNQSEVRSVGARSQVQSFQAGTSADWIPDDDIPLRVFGNARYYQQTAGNQSASTVALGSNASYTYNRNWRFDANAQFFNTTVGGQQFSTLSVGANAGWTGEGLSRNFGPWFYSLGYGATSGVSVVAGSNVSEASVFAGGNVGQGVSRAIDLGLGTPIMISLNQSYGTSFSQTVGISQTLSHSASANWAFSQGSDYSLSASLLGSDSRSFGATESEFQSITATSIGNIVLSPYSSVSASVNAGLSRQGVSAVQTGASAPASAAIAADWIGTASGSVNYQHGRFMRVPGLFYDASYTVNYRPETSRLLGDLDAAPTGLGVDHIFRQQWRWRVGQLGLTLNNTFTFTANASSASIFLFVTRDIGGVL